MDKNTRANFVTSKLAVIHKACQEVADELGPLDPLAIAMTSGWNFMHTVVRIVSKEAVG